MRHDGRSHVADLAEAGAYELVAPITLLVELSRGAATKNPADGKVGLRAALVLDALYRSALSGRMEAQDQVGRRPPNNDESSVGCAREGTR